MSKNNMYRFKFYLIISLLLTCNILLTIKYEPYDKVAKAELIRRAQRHETQVITVEDFPTVEDVLGRSKELDYEDQAKMVMKEIGRLHQAVFMPVFNRMMSGSNSDGKDSDEEIDAKEIIAAHNVLANCDFKKDQFRLLANHLRCTPARNTIVEFIASKGPDITGNSLRYSTYRFGGSGEFYISMPGVDDSIDR